MLRAPILARAQAAREWASAMQLVLLHTRFDLLDLGVPASRAHAVAAQETTATLERMHELPV